LKTKRTESTLAFRGEHVAVDKKYNSPRPSHGGEGGKANENGLGNGNEYFPKLCGAELEAKMEVE